MRWFKHDTDASADAKLKKVRHKYGFEGYGFYWYLVECIAAGVSKSNISFKLEEDIETISIDWRVDSSKIAEMMNYFIELNLLGSDGKNVNCFKIARRLDDTNSKHPQIKQLLKIIEENKITENIPLNFNNSELVGLSRSESDFVSPDQIRSDQIRVDKDLKDIVEKNKNDEFNFVEIDIDIDIEADNFIDIELPEDENFISLEDYQNFLSSENVIDEDSKKKADKKKADKLAEAEEAFSIFWQAGMRKSGDKKKAINKFILLAKQRKQTLTEFGEFLKSDIQQRIANNQFGFDSLLPTTYLNGERFNDEQQQTFTSDSGIDKTSGNQNSGESRSMQQARVAMAEQRRKFESS